MSRSQAQRDSVRKAAAVSAKNRKRAAAQRRETAERRARQLTPGHHESCRCESCIEAASAAGREQ